MKIRSYLLLLLTLGLLTIWVGCGGQRVLNFDTATESGKTVATFGRDGKFTTRTLFDKMFWSGVYPEGGVVPDSVVREFRDSVLIDSLQDIKADTMDLRDHWQYFNIARKMYYDSLSAAFLKNEIDDKLNVTPSDVRVYWSKHPDDFLVSEQILFSHFMSSAVGFMRGRDSLLFKDDSAKAADWAYERVFMVHEMLDLGAPFREVARIYSHDVLSNNHGGLVGWTLREHYTDPFDSVAFSLEPGHYSEPYHNDDGWHIILVNRKINAGPMPIDSPGIYPQVEKIVVAKLREERLKQFRDSVQPLTKVEIFDSLMGVPVDSLGDFTPLAVVGGRDTLYAGQFIGLEQNALAQPGETHTAEEIRRSMVSVSIGPLVMISAARDLGYDTLPAVRRARDEVWKHQAKIALEESEWPRIYIPPDHDKQKAYYQAHIERYSPSRPFEVEDLETKDSALAAFLKTQAETGLTLSALEKEWGERQGYDVVYHKPWRFAEQEVPEGYWKAAKITAPGVFRVARGDSSYFLILMVDRTEPKSFSEAWGEVRADMLRDSIETVYTSYRDSVFAADNVQFAKELPIVELEPIMTRQEHRAKLRDVKLQSQQ